MITGSQIVEQWDRWDSERSAAKTLVRQVYEYCLPRRGVVLAGKSPGQDLHAELFDSTAETACERFATGLYDFMCPPSRSWVMLTPPIEYGRMAGDFSRPLLGISETIRDEISRSNFAEAIYELFLDLGTAGSGTLEPSRGTDSLLEFTAHPYEQVVFQENRRGRVDAVERKFSWTARQIVQEFGDKDLPKAISDAWNEDGGKDKRFDIVHAALPRDEFTSGERDVLNMPIASLWASVTDKAMLRKSGWPQLRYLVCRFAKASGEKEGRSPGMTCLPDVKMVNKIEETTIIGAENAVGPSLLCPDGSFLPNIKMKPRSMMWYRVNPLNPLVKPEPLLMGADVRLGVEYGDAKRQIIMRAFFNDLFMILSDDKRRTATEVREILAEKLNLLGPNFGRLKVEMFDPMVRILLSILGEVPAYLRGVPMGLLNLANIRYTSTLALAMEYAELTSMQDTLMFLSPFAEIDPTVWDNFSFDEISRGIAEKMALPPRWLKPRDEVRALREARMKYQAAMMQQQMAMQQQAMLGKLGKRAEPGSPGERMMAEAA